MSDGAAKGPSGARPVPADGSVSVQPMGDVTQPQTAADVGSDRTAGAAPGDQRLRDELLALEGQLCDTRAELDEARSDAGDNTLERAHAMAVSDRDRAIAQHEEAVADREAAVRTRARMEAQRDDALAQLELAHAHRDEAIAERDEARRQRDEVLLAHKALQRQLKGEWAKADKTRRVRGSQADAQPDAEAPPGEVPTMPAADDDEPLGVRVIPATRTIAPHLHRGERMRDHGITSFDLWAIRVLGSVAAVCFIALLIVLALTAFFVF